MIYRARTVYPVVQPPISNGAVWVEENVIRSVGRWEEIAPHIGSTPVVDLGEQILLPGLINAHCHLDYTMMRRAIMPQTSFTSWIKRINALKRAFVEADYFQAIADGFKELIQWGTTSVYNIEAFPELVPHLPKPPIRTWWFYEMIDIRHRTETDEFVAGALSFFDRKADWLGGFGLSPHAPFTASADLFRMSQQCGSQTGMPLTTHLAESREEWQMFQDASGNLYDFLKGLGRDMSDCGNSTPLRWFLNSGLDPRKWLLVHLNEVSDTDLHTLGDNLAGMSIVHCPLSHAYFSHRPFRASELAQHGALLCLGTDSLASTQSLNLFQEMRQFAKQHPEFSPSAIVRMVTINAARALRNGSTLGQIQEGALADLIAIPDGRNETAAETILNHRAPVDWMMVDGKQIGKSLASTS